MLTSNNEARREVSIDKWHAKGYTGAGIHVVVLDNVSGVLKHMPYATAPLVRADYGSAHGTNVAQVVHEFAPGAKITLVPSSEEGRQWIKDNIATIDIINVSMSSQDINHASRMFGFLADFDVPVPCSSGNYSKNGVLADVRYPAKFDWAIATGAYNWRDGGVNANAITSYSNGGASLKVSSVTNIFVKNAEGREFTFDGTSAAAPSLSGILACYAEYLKAQGKRLTRAKAFEFVTQNVRDLYAPGHDHKSGYGLIYVGEPKDFVKATPPVAEPVTQKFTDVGPSSAAFKDVQELSDLGIINGFADGTFKPNETVTRGQFSIMVNRLIKHLKDERSDK